MQDVVFHGTMKGAVHKACRLTEKLMLIDCTRRRGCV